MAPPIQVLFAGLVLSVLGAVITYAGVDTDTAGVLFLGWAAGGVGGLLLFVGLIAVSVEIGVRSARR